MSTSDPTESLDFELIDEDSPVRIKKRWPLFVLIFFLAAIVLSVVWLITQEETEPHSFLIAISVEDDAGEAHFWWEGNEAAVAVSRAFSEQLEGFGLNPTGFGHEAEEVLEGARSLEEIRNAASKLDAGLVITGSVRITHAVPLDGEMLDYSIELELGFFDVEAGASPTVLDESLHFFEWGQASEVAIQAAAERMASAGAAPLAARLVESPRLADLTLSNDEQTYDEAAIADRIQPLFRIAGFYDTQRQERVDDQKNAELRYTALEVAPQARRRLGGFLDQESFVGQGPGEALVLLTEPHYFEVRPDEGHYGIRRESERLMLAGDGGERRLLFEHFNFYSSQSVSSDGSTLAAVLDNRGRSKWLIALTVPDAEVKMLRSSGSAYFSTPTISPDGLQIAYWFSEYRRAPSALELIDVSGDSQAVLIAPGMKMSLPCWHPDSAHLYLALGEHQRAEIVEISTKTAERRCLLGACARPEPVVSSPELVEGALPDGDAAELEGEAALMESPDPFLDEPPRPFDPRYDSRFLQVSVDPVGGRFLIVQERDPEGREHLGRFDLAEQRYTRLASLEIDWFLISPDGAYVAVTSSGAFADADPGSYDQEIVIVPTQGGEFFPITLNDIDDYLQGWSRDGAHVYSAQSSRDPASRRYSTRVFEIDVN